MLNQQFSVAAGEPVTRDDTSGALSSWNSAHTNQNCANTAQRGGAVCINCFARN
jgi:hypothetical protein